MLSGAIVLLAACTATPGPSPVPPPGADYHLLMGEIALARNLPDVAVAQYAEASRRTGNAGTARRATLIAVHAGNFDAARAAADRWETLAPNDVELAQFQALLHARDDETREALRYLLRVADGENGASGASLQAITGLLAGETNRWRAADLMAGVAAARPAFAEGWYGAGLLALAADRPARAVAFAKRALEIAPELLDAKVLKARGQLVLQAGAGASETVLQPLASLRHSADPGQRYRYAELLILAGRDAEADALLEDILVNDPDQHDARITRAALALETGRPAVAEEELHTLLGRHGRVQDALYSLGLVAERRGALNEAIEWYSRVSPEVPQWLDAQAGIGRLLIEIEGPDAAAAFFTELRGYWPEHKLPLTLHEAVLLTVSGYPERALPLLDELASVLGGDNQHHHGEFALQTALVAAEAGKMSRAETLLRELLAQDPRNPALRNALGYLLIEYDNRLDEAEALLEQAHVAAPANPAILDSLGWLRYRQERFGEARRLLEESWRREPTTITGMHLLTTLLTIDSVAAADFRVEMRERFPRLKDFEGNR